MLRGSLFLLALLLLGMASLTAVRVPVAVNWRLALLAGEYGHVLWLLPAGIALAAWFVRHAHFGWSVATGTVGLAAIAFFLKPSMQAAALARDLPARMRAQFGGDLPASPAFSVAGLFRGAPAAIQPQAHRIGPDLPMDFYRPATVPAGGVPCIVVIHGGGWDSGDRSQLPGFNHWLVAQGYAVAAISYRLAPAHPWPAQRDDTLAAITYLRANAAALGLDPARIVLAGRSAGGQIAAAVGYTADDPGIRGVVAFYAPFDMRFVWSISRDDDALNSLKLMRQYLGGPPEGREDLYDSASAQQHVRRGRTPPTLMVHGVIDTLVWHRHSERLSARLVEEGVPHLHLSLPWAVHAVEFNLAGPSGQLTAYALKGFLARVTAP
jgi:acetyl esterase/lipase